jgi:solute:Na+ symporter, SSS family
MFLYTPAGESFPAQLAGFLMAVTGMVVGSLGPQAIRDRQGSHHHLVGVHDMPIKAGG